MERYTILACILIAIPSIVYSDTDPNYRLNTPIKPKSYSISITPYFDTGDDKAFSFDGEVDITFTTQNATKQIKLHSEELIFNETSITVVNGANNIELDYTNGLEFDTNYTFAFINLKTELQTGIDYSLKIVYTGPIRDDLNGFYSNYYIQNGTKKWLGATQMEPTHARKVFPCFDEPELKATFIITINRPQNYKPSLANTKLQNTLSLPNGYVREIFYPTPVMSTYLVAFMVSEFEGIGVTNASRSFGVYTRPEAINQTAYTIDFGGRVVTALGQYFNIDYYSTNEHLKLDHVALPDFKAGAMENWGLIKYREALLLYVPGVSNPYYKYRVAQIVAHETTHMWFGNLVTCHWWSNTWLNEGFANYFQDYITSLIEPDIGASHMLVIGSVYSAYDADSSPESAPITNNDVNSPTEISGHFGTITYQKAGSVIRMMHHLIGDDAFKLGLHSYLIANQFSVGYPEKMYEALDAGAKQYNSLQSYPDSRISEVMGSWISQAGHPVVEVDVHRDLKKMVLSQKRFYIDSSHKSNEIYSIPISYTTQMSPNFDDTKPVIIMANKTIEVNLPDINADTWILLNIQETGLYRVSYDDQTYDLISKALKSSDRKNIHHLNRAKIVNDLFAFLYCNEVKFDRIHDVLEFMTDETEYTVWYAAIKGLNKLYNSYLGTDASNDIKNYALKILNPIVSTVLYNQSEGEEFEETRNRMQVLEFACKLEHAGCIEYAVKLFRELRDEGKEITPSLRPVAYCTGLRHGNGDDYEFLWNRMKTTNYAGEARVISDVLGCTNVEDKLKSYLVSSLEENSPIRIQDVTAPLTSILADYSHLDFVLEQLKTNYTLWTTIYPSMDPVVTLVASNLHTDQDFTEFQSFLDSCTDCSAELKTAALKTVTQAKAQASWARSHMEDIIANLRNSGAIVAPSLLLVCSLALLADFNF